MACWWYIILGIFKITAAECQELTVNIVKCLQLLARNLTLEKYFSFHQVVRSFISKISFYGGGEG